MKNLVLALAVLVSASVQASGPVLIGFKQSGNQNKYNPCFGSDKNKCAADESSAGSFIEFDNQRVAYIVFPKYQNMKRKLGKLTYDDKFIELGDDIYLDSKDGCYADGNGENGRRFSASGMGILLNEEKRRKFFDECTTYLLMRKGVPGGVSKIGLYFVSWN